jgi:hypothetical protein
MIGQRVREGLAESDKTLGRVRPSGEWSRTAAVSDVILAVLRDARDAACRRRRIADRLNAYGHRSLRGWGWHRTSVLRLLHGWRRRKAPADPSVLL